MYNIKLQNTYSTTRKVDERFLTVLRIYKPNVVVVIVNFWGGCTKTLSKMSK